MADREVRQIQERPSGFPTEALLDDQIAAADELRADVERLRRQLDDGPPPLLPGRKRSRKPLLGALIVVGALGVAGTVVLLPGSDSEPPTAAPSIPKTPSTPKTQSTPNVSSAPNASNIPKATSSPQSVNSPQASGSPEADSALAPRSAPAGSLPSTGPGIDQPGTMMLVQVASDGTLDVIEQALPGPNRLPLLDLRLPSVASLGGQVGELTPTVHDLRVAVNRTPVLSAGAGDGLGWMAAAADGEPTRLVQLSYQLKGSIVRTKPSRSGRALAVSLPLLAQDLREAGLPLVVRAEGAAVEGATCPGAPTTQMLCGERVNGGWVATVPAEAATPAVLLQVTLR